jgi:hypothetical protein
LDKCRFQRTLDGFLWVELSVGIGCGGGEGQGGADEVVMM